MKFSYRLVNVFAESAFGGNPLCVFENALGLSDAQMQSIALQFNLSETVFIFPSTTATARMRIFTTSHEMSFAGHPTLGTAHVVRDLMRTGDEWTLECNAGIIAVQAQQDVWTFTAPMQGMPMTHPCSLLGADVAQMLGLQAGDLLGEPIWVNTGTDQLLVPLHSVDAVQRAQPNASFPAEWPQSRLGRRTAYVFAWDQIPDDPHQRLQITSRYFFSKQGGVAEDPGTGSACANLGGWWLAQQYDLPVAIAISQGERVQRPSRLFLDVYQDRRIQVGGRVLDFGSGVIDFPID